MTTTRDVIEQALRDLGAIPAGETLEAEDAVDALPVFNQMMHGIANHSGDLGWADLVLTDDLPVRERHVGPIRQLLSRHLAPMHSIVLTANQAAFAQEAENTLQVAYSSIPELVMDEGLEDRIDNFGSERI